MKKIVPILLVCLVSSCADSNKNDPKNTNLKQAPVATVIGKRIEGGASPSAYIYNHETNDDVIYFGYEYSKEQLDSVYGTCTCFSKNADPDGGATYWYDEEGIRIDLEYGNFNGLEEKWVCSILMDKGFYTLHITDSLEVKVGDNINELNLSHHKYLKQIEREEHNDTVSLYYTVYPDCDCPSFFVVEHKNDTITYVRYDDICF
jgi:hypothetical protein